MPVRPSKPGERRGGRQKGTTNKLTSTLRLAFEQTFLQLQELKLRRDKSGNIVAAKGKEPKAVALYDWALENPGEFYRIAARLIPQEHSGVGGGPIPVGVTGTVALYLPDNGRGVKHRKNGGNGNGQG